MRGSGRPRQNPASGRDRGRRRKSALVAVPALHGAPASRYDQDSLTVAAVVVDTAQLEHGFPDRRAIDRWRAVNREHCNRRLTVLVGDGCARLRGDRMDPVAGRPRTAAAARYVPAWNEGYVEVRACGALPARVLL